MSYESPELHPLREKIDEHFGEPEKKKRTYKRKPWVYREDYDLMVEDRNLWKLGFKSACWLMVTGWIAFIISIVMR